MGDKNYDHVPLLKKLGVKDGQSLLVLGFDDASFLEGRAFQSSFAQGDLFDLIFLRAESMPELDVFESLVPVLARDGGIWTVTPKGVKSFSSTMVIERGRAAGLNDIKVCSFSPTHTGQKFVRWKHLR